MNLFQALIKAARCSVRSTYRRALVLHGVAAGVEHEALLRILEPVSVVDIGANRGQFALAVRGCRPTAKIASFEPLPSACATFRRVFADDAAVTLHPVAVGRHSGPAVIHVSGRDDSSSLLPITDQQAQLFPGTAEVRTETATLRTLDECLGPADIVSPALLKVDVQGFELEVLKGCESVLQGFNHVYVECSFLELYQGQALADAVVAWLRDKGFRLSGCYHVHYDKIGRAVQADLLFSHV
jgi:FkbM family methyltransferase